MAIVITRAHIKDGFTYEEYRQMGRDLLLQNKTTGPAQTEKLVEYSKLNNQRMDRLDKTMTIGEGLTKTIKALKQPMTWVVLTEFWCGDAAQNVPVFAKMEEVNRGKIRLALLLRDENPEIMDAYLTNGSRAIPRLIALDAAGNELFTWGPRPQPAQQILLDYRVQGAPADVDYKRDIQVWYIKDHAQTLQEEMNSLLLPFTV